MGQNMRENSGIWALPLECAPHGTMIEIMIIYLITLRLLEKQAPRKAIQTAGSWVLCLIWSQEFGWAQKIEACAF